MSRPSTFRWISALILSLLFTLPQGVQAQPICSIDLGADTTICAGETVTLTAPPGFPTYNWNTGAGSQSITVGTAGVYACSVTYPTGNMAVNPNFSNGNTGFTSMFAHALPMTTEGNYWIGTNANLLHNQWVATGNGPFLMVNAGWMHGGYRFWCQTHPVCPGQTYTIAFRGTSLASQGAPLLAVFVNNDLAGEIQIAAPQGQWNNYALTWTAPAGVTSGDFCIQISSGHGVGNDLGFDDVSISANVVLTDEVVVNVTPLPVVDLGPDATLCTGQSLMLDAGVPGGTYLWQDGSTDPSFNVTGPGTYSVTVTADNCSNTGDITVDYNPTPVVDLGPDMTLCDGETTVLDATTPGATYTWQDGSTGPTFTVDQAGFYNVNVLLDGCPASDNVTVDYNPLPVVDLGPDVTLCAGEQVTFNATVPGATYLWQDGSTGPTLTTSNAGAYNVTVTLNGCSSSDAVNVAVNPLPVVDLGPDVTLCAGQTLLLDATTPGATYTWQDGSTGPTFTVSQAGNYNVTVLLNGCSASDAMTASYNPLPVVDLGPDVTLCAGEQVTFNATVPGATYLWQNGSTNPTLTIATAGAYNVVVTLNGCSSSDAVNVAVNPLPVVDLGPDVTLCAGQTMVLNATTPGATYTWQDGSTGPTFTVSQAGNYNVTVLLNGCSASDAMTASYNPLPVVDLGPDVSLCAGEQVSFNATVPGATYLWTNGSTGPTLTTGTAGNHGVTVTLNGCSSSDAVNVSVNPVPVVNLGPDQVVCPGTNVTLNATTPGATYLWNTGAISPTLTVSTPGTYSVEVTANGCTGTDAVTIDHFSLQTVNLGPDVTICQGASATLGTVIPGATYAWSNGATSATLNVSSAGLRWVDVTLNGCTVRDSIEVFVTPLPVVNLGPDDGVCPGSTMVLNATAPGATYLWSTGAVSPTITVGPGSYDVTVTAAGCSASDAITINEHIVAPVDLGPDQTLCQGESLVLNATLPGATYLWSDGSSGPTLIVTSTGLVGVQRTDANGCITSDQVTVTFLPAPSFDLGPDIAFCAGQTHTINGPVIAGAIYAWNTGEATPSLTVSDAGTYSLTVTVGGCQATDAVNVNVLPAPSVELGPDIALCPGESTVLDATVAGGTYLWSTGATSPTITVNTAGTYSVQVSANGCSSSDAVSVSVLSASTVELGPNVQICAGATVLLDATTPGATYLWNTGATSPTITVGTAGTYNVEVSQGQCSVTDAVEVSVLPAPVVDLGGDQTLCDGETDLLLDATNAGATYLWNTGATTPTLLANSSGTYSVEVDLNGCTATDEVAIAFGTVTFSLGADTVLCPGATLALEVTLPNGTVWWNSTPTTGPSFTVTGPGSYWAEFVAANGGCGATDTIMVTYATPGALDLGPDQMICAGTSLTLDATLPGATYLWSTGATSPTISIDTDGTYSVTATVGTCAAQDEITVTVQPLPTPDIGPDAAICPGAATTFNATTQGATYLWQDGSTASTYTTDLAEHVQVTVTVSGCSASDEASVSLLDAPVVHLGNDTTLCAPSTLVLDATTPGATYLWNDGSTTPTLIVGTAGSYNVTVTLNGCTDNDAIAIDVFESANVALGPDVQLCPGTTTVLSTGLADVGHTWSTGATGAAITVGTAGIYWVDAGIPGCMARDSVTVSVVPLPMPDLGPDLTFCAGDTAQLAVSAGSAAISWNTGATTPTIDVWADGNYTVMLTLAGCTASDAVQVTVLDSITDLGLVAETTYCIGQDLRLQVPDVPGASYLWNTGSTSPWIQVGMPGTYSIQAQGPCMLASAVVEVIEGDCAPFVHVPNAFTPNDDGFNDVFVPVVDGTALSYRFDIHGRWGELLFSSNKVGEGWDGSYNGTPVQDGVYVWTLTYRSESQEGKQQTKRRGHVTLLR